jgi:hypothetical protein
MDQFYRTKYKTNTYLVQNDVVALLFSLYYYRLKYIFCYRIVLFDIIKHVEALILHYWARRLVILLEKYIKSKLIVISNKMPQILIFSPTVHMVQYQNIIVHCGCKVSFEKMHNL